MLSSGRLVRPAADDDFVSQFHKIKIIAQNLPKRDFFVKDTVKAYFY